MPRNLKMLKNYKTKIQEEINENSLEAIRRATEHIQGRLREHSGKNLQEI